jgi:hypothetical protein
VDIQLYNGYFEIGFIRRTIMFRTLIFISLLVLTGNAAADIMPHFTGSNTIQGRAEYAYRLSKAIKIINKSLAPVPQSKLDWYYLKQQEIERPETSMDEKNAYWDSDEYKLVAVRIALNQLIGYLQALADGSESAYDEVLGWMNVYVLLGSPNNPFSNLSDLQRSGMALKDSTAGDLKNDALKNMASSSSWLILERIIFKYIADRPDIEGSQR